MACRPKRTAVELLWLNVSKGPGCWIRPGSAYHPIEVDGRRTAAHRLSWELANGRQVPAGMYVCHSCDNPRCVRPDHLWLGTNRDNQLDALAKGRLPIGERNARALLSQKQALEIRARADAGESPTLLGREFHVSRSTVQAIRARRNWRAAA
jgi:hypothetical protein